MEGMSELKLCVRYHTSERVKREESFWEAGSLSGQEELVSGASSCEWKGGVSGNMSGSGEVVCEGWLRKSPPEKKLRRYAWKRRWFVLRSGRLSGEPDVLQYYKNPHSRRPIRTIDLNLCEQVDAGLSFTKKELENSFAFDLRTEERTWYLVAETEEDMNRWVSSICLLCGFNPTDDIPSRPPAHEMSSIPPASRISATAITGISNSLPEPYNAVRVSQMESNGSMEDDYLWLSNCQSHIGPPKGSCTSLEVDSNSQHPRPSAASSSCSSSSSSPSLPPNAIALPPASSSGLRTVPWTVASSSAPRSQSLDASLTPDLQKPGSKFRCHPSPHPRKHSLDFHLRPVAIPADVTQAFSGYQFPRPASTPQPPPHRRPSSTPSVDSLTQAELYSSTPTPPPRPPKPASMTTPTEGADVENRSDTNLTTASEKEGSNEGGVNIPRSRAISAPGHTKTGCDSVFIPRSLSDRASMFDFSESFNSYFLNKGMVPLGSVCSEDDEVDENYVPMSAATTEPPITARAAPAAPTDISLSFHEANYVSMTPHPSGFTALPNPSTTDLSALGRQVLPVAYVGFRSSPLTPAPPLTPPLRRNTLNTSVGMEVSAVPPPVHRNLKPQRKGVCMTPPGDRRETAGERNHKTRVKPAPLNITPVQQDWQEVPPPVRSPVTRTFTRDPSSFRSVGPNSGHSSSLSSDSDEPDDNYVPMTTPNLSISAGESSLRLMMHRASEGGVSSPLPRRARSDKQVEYLDLDLHTGRSTPTRQQKRSTEDRGADDKSLNGQSTRVDYVVVDPTKTKALRNTREAWHGGRMSTEKEK
ncbi:GRB2-associated-binding protein 1-like isoform 2-T2 [Synchiropus picturatus]